MSWDDLGEPSLRRIRVRRSLKKWWDEADEAEKTRIKNNMTIKESSSLSEEKTDNNQQLVYDDLHPFHRE